MLYSREYLDNEGNHVFLDVYVPDKIYDVKRKAILVIPGGAYNDICSAREGEPIALEFVSRGFNAFVLSYSVRQNSDDIFPKQLIQASKAIKYIKDHAKEHGTDPEKVFAVGFSAGGHLAGSLATMWDKKEIYEEVDMPVGYNKLTGAILCYPVVSTDIAFSHIQTFRNLFDDKNIKLEDVEFASIEKNVSPKSSPAFIMHTAEDELVNVKNSIALASAYADNNVMFELHIYPKGPHGIALANSVTSMGKPELAYENESKWVDDAVCFTDNF